MPEADTAKKSITKFLADHPIIILSGFIIGVIGLVFSIYTYFAGRTFPELTYGVHPVRAIVVKAGQVSRLKAIYDNKAVETDISAVQIAIWNKGKQAIKRSNVLKPVVISTENNVPILEATIRNVSRDVTNIGLELNTNELQKGRVAISWDILEHKDGCVIQLIYAGDLSVNISLEGIMEGQSYIKCQSLNKASLNKDVFTSIVLPILYSAFFMYLIYDYLRSLYRHTKYRVTKNNFPAWIVHCSFVIMIFVIAFYPLYKLLIRQGPPFGF